MKFLGVKFEISIHSQIEDNTQFNYPKHQEKPTEKFHSSQKAVETKRMVSESSLRK